MRTPKNRRWYRTSPGDIRHSLTFRLLLWLSVVVVAGFAGYTLLSLDTMSREWRASIDQEARRATDVVLRSTHHGMLLNRKDDVHHLIRTVAGAPGVVGIRIYDKEGTIIHSARPEEIGRRVDLEAEACVVCHERDEPLRSVPDEGRTRIFRLADGSRVLGLINPIQNAPECSSADCHAHPTEQSVLGVLDVQMSMAQADATIATARRQAFAAAMIVLLLLAAATWSFLDRVVRRPVRRLIRHAERIARGDLEGPVEIGTRDEIGQLSRALDRMRSDLLEARRRDLQWSSELERKVVEKTEELGHTQRQIGHMEKMASLGKLAATVAHELNNPLAGILNYAKLMGRTLGESMDPGPERGELTRSLELIQKETSRCGSIVRNLLLFARSHKTDFASHTVWPILERSLLLVRHHLEISNVVLETQREQGDDRIVCDADQIQQALVALFVNAVEAMPRGGTLRVGLAPGERTLAVTITDTGVGIPPESMANIFEPFFTTKDAGSGVGLGLAVVYGIVQRHGGHIEVRSEPGQGTTFAITLPRHPPDPDADTVAVGARDDADRATSGGER